MIKVIILGIIILGIMIFVGRVFRYWMKKWDKKIQKEIDEIKEWDIWEDNIK